MDSGHVTIDDTDDDTRTISILNSGSRFHVTTNYAKTLIRINKQQQQTILKRQAIIKVSPVSLAQYDLTMSVKNMRSILCIARK